MRVQRTLLRALRRYGAAADAESFGAGRGRIGLILGWLLVAIASQTAWAQHADAKGMSALDPGLKAAMAARVRANLEGDTAQIETLTAAEYVQTDIGGRVQNRAEWLATYFKPLAEMIRGGEFRWTLWEETDVQTRSFGDTVVVVGKLKLEGVGAAFVPGRDWVKSPGSRLGPATLSFTRVWIKRDGKWLLAAIHNAVPPPSPVK